MVPAISRRGNAGLLLLPKRIQLPAPVNFTCCVRISRADQGDAGGQGRRTMRRWLTAKRGFAGN